MSETPQKEAGQLLPASWRVQLPVFEGPLDLLLHLIRINKVEITDIPVAVVCDQFHEYLRLMEELDLDIAAEFIYEAAVLIQIKSKLLLPQAGRGADEPGEDPRHELVSRLLEYRRLKEAAQALAEVDRVRQGVWTRKPAPWKPEGVEEDVEVRDLDLAALDGLGAQAVEVEVDTDTGDVTIVRVVAAHDCGWIVNPLMVVAGLETINTPEALLPLTARMFSPSPLMIIRPVIEIGPLVRVIVPVKPG